MLFRSELRDKRLARTRETHDEQFEEIARQNSQEKNQAVPVLEDNLTLLDDSAADDLFNQSLDMAVEE